MKKFHFQFKSSAATEDSHFIAAKRQFHKDIFEGAIGFCEKALKEYPDLAKIAFNEDGQTALHMAMMSSNRTTQMIDLLLTFGANINVRTQSGKSPLMSGVGRGSTLECVEYLVDRGADVFGKPRGDQANWSVLHEAAANAQDDIVRLLIDRGGKELIEDMGPGGLRALHKAVQGGKPSTCKILLHAGADPMAVIDSGYCPVSLAAKQLGAKSPMDILEMTLFLIAFGGDTKKSLPSLRLSHFKYTMEMAAAACGDTERLLDLHRLRKAQGQKFSTDEICNIHFAAMSNNQTGTVAVIDSIHALDLIDGVLAQNSKALDSMVR